MSQQSEIQVYVSYSRHEEEQKKTICDMQNKLQDIAFKIDTEQVKYRDDFMNFIKMIGQADYIVVVFSRDYFESFYCMYELTKIIQFGGDIKKRVFLIRDENYDLNNRNNQANITDYWQQVVAVGDGARPEGLTKYGSLEEVTEVQKQLENIFNQFSTTHAPTSEKLAPTFKVLFDDSYHEIRRWLKKVMPEVVLAGKKQIGDDKFIFKVEKEITRIFKRFPVLYQILNDEFENVDDESELAKMLCTNKDQTDLLTYILMGACKEAVLSFKQKESNVKVQELKIDIRKLLSCLCVMAIPRLGNKTKW